MFTQKSIPIAFLLVVSISILLSCKKKNIDITSYETVNKPLYFLEIHGAGGVGATTDSIKTVVGENIESNWDQDLGLIWLGTDKVNLPIATLTMEIDTVMDYLGTKRAHANNITLSTTDARTGTADVLNAKLYHTPSDYIYQVKIGGNYIKAYFERMSMTELNTGRKVFVGGYFIAMDK